MATRFKTHAVNFMDWAMGEKCPYGWYDGLWYDGRSISIKEAEGITTAELYEIWLQEKH